MAKATKKEQEIIDKAIKRLDKCIKADQHNRTAALEDLRFANGEQWDAGEKKRRSDKGRPALQINLLPKFLDQVVGDMLHNSPTIKVRPIDSKADINIAKIRQGIISNVEYLSNSKSIYGYAGRQQVTSGYGAWRVLTRYTEENPFLQEAYLESIRNPFLVYMDPSAKDQNYADAKYGFLLEKMSKEDFKERFPSAQYPSNDLKLGTGVGSENWYDGDTCTVAEYFTAEQEEVEMLQLSDGRVVTKDELDVITKEWEEKNEALLSVIRVGQSQPPVPQQSAGGTPPIPPVGMKPQTGPTPTATIPQAPKPLQQGQQSAQVPQPAAPMAPPQPNPAQMLLSQAKALGEEPKIAKRRMTKKTIIRHRILTCCEILEGGEKGNKFPGRFIPLVIVKGKELNIEGKNYVYSLIRHAKDPQKLINYWNTAAAETIALAPKAPWLGTPKQFEGFENDYAAANVENFPMLKYNPDPEAPGPPLRQSPGQPPVAIFEQIRRGEENLKSVIGMFNADVGAPGSEQTGAAIVARQKPGDIGTFEFMENLTRAVTYTGRILNEIIPEIYDTERDVRLRNIDETETFVPVNTTVGNAIKAIEDSPEMYTGLDINRLKKLLSKDGKDAKFNDLTAGKYDVVATAGPSYATQRQEAAQQLLQMTQAMPQQMAIASDLIVRNLDFKDSEELETRLRKTLPPGMAKPKPGEPPTQPPPPNPAVVTAQSKMQVEQSKIQLAQMKIDQEKIKLEHEKMKMQLEMAKMQMELKQASMDNSRSDQLDAEERRTKFMLERRRLALEEAKFQHQTGMDVKKFLHQSAMDIAGLSGDSNA